MSREKHMRGVEIVTQAFQLNELMQMTFVRLIEALAVFGSLLLLFAYPAIAAENNIAEDWLEPGNSQIPEEMQKAIIIGGDLWREHGSYNTIVTFRVGDGPEWELVPVNSGGLEYVGMLKASQKASEFAQAVANMVSMNSNKPDIVPLDRIAVSPKNPKSKERIDMEYATVNPSQVDVSGNFVTRLNLPGGYKADCNFNGLPALSWGSCGAYIVGFDAGTYSLKATVDVFNQVSESDENNNVYTQSLVISKPDVDLVVEKVLTEPETPSDKGTFSIEYHVRNIGSDNVKEPFKSTLYIDGKELIRLEHGGGAPSGQLQKMSITGNTLPKGMHKIKVVVDEENAIDETAEGNNQKEVEVGVSHVKVYDMAVTGIYTLPAEVNDKVTFSVNYVIKNNGEDSVEFDEFEGELFRDGVKKQTCRMPAVEEGLYPGEIYTCSYQNQQWAAGKYSVKTVVGFWGGDDVDSSNNELAKLIEIASSCPIPDGSSADCECNSSSDCSSGYYCEFRTGLDACVKVTCEDECISQGFFCNEGDAYECGNFDSDSCSDKRIADACGVGEVCSEGERNCQTDPTPIEIRAEDASAGTAVYKQPDDLIEVTLNSEKLQSIIFSYPENFTLISGNCTNGAISVAGAKACLFRISETIAEGNYYFSAKSKVAKVTVTESPSTIIVTNKQKLRERFFNDPSGVDALLKQAFQFANAQGNTVVYYLDRELQDHPFASFSGYGESVLSPSLSSNAYGMAAAEFVNEKCGQCRNTIILGDDYVVPFYRVDYATIYGWWQWWVQNKTETSSIYSDQPYIKENRKTVGDISSLFDSSEHKNVKIVIPDAPSAEVQERVEQLKSVLRSGFEYDDNEISVINSGKVGCNSYGTLDKATLILIGSRDDNNAIKCVPWFDVGRKPTDTFKASIEVERNVWANNEYAIVVSGPDLSSGLDNLISMLNYPDYFEGTMLGGKSHVYIQDFSNPPDLPPDLAETGSHIIGFVLGTCEEGNFAGEKGACIATDMVAGVVPPTDIITDIRDTVLYCPAFIWNKATGKKAPILDGLACGGSAAGTGITIGKYVTAVTGVGAVAGTVADGGSTALKTVLKVTKASLKSGADRMIKVFDKIQLFKFENARVFFKAGKDESAWSAVTKFAKTTSENSKYINKLTEYFPEDVLAATIKNVDDYEGVAVGTKKVLQNYKTLDEFETGIKVCNGPCRAPTKIEAAENLKNTGKAAAKGIPIVKLSELPKEAEDTVKLIEKGGPFPYPKHDGGIFDNRVPFGKKESLLPEKTQKDYYTEYTVETPGAVDRGKKRIVAGKNGEIFYTDDHYSSFKQVMKNGK